MAFLRFSRDKRGYENVYLVQPAGRRGKSLPRLLYWFRTPPNLKVGREPFDESVRRSLEAQHPDVAFDWPSLIATPFPPAAETERWRDRRRERAARRAADAEVEVEATAPNPESEAAPERAPSSASAVNLESAEPADAPAGPGNAGSDEESGTEQAVSGGAQPAGPGNASPASAAAPRPRHRRRRRRQRPAGV